jgi:hypothetical protein
VLRVAAAAYALALAATSAGTARRVGWRDAIGLPAVFAVMHTCWGAGFLAGCVRWGPPWRGARQVLSSWRR